MKKLMIAVTVLTVIATPVLAQSFDPEYGTGNVLPFRYEPAASQKGKTIIGQRGLNAYALDRGFSAGNPNSREATGGGSPGYNDSLLHD